MFLPVGRHSRPLFLKLPINSFFLQSTEIIGARLVSNVWQVFLICKNCWSRSGCYDPSMFFLVALSEKPSEASTSARADFLMVCFWAASADTRLANDLVVHRVSDMGSPFGSTSDSRSAIRVGSCSANLFRPPPACRTRSLRGGCRTSASPLRIVFRSDPDALATMLMPPRPILAASVPRYIRHWSSLSRG